MKIFAISDLHLSIASDKPMNVFGGSWEGYWEKIKENWLNKVTENDVVLIAGDISWGMSLEQALPDLEAIAALPGKKVLTKGNHDYWWSTYKKITSLNLEKMYFIQNNAVKIGDYIFCGTRGWTVDDDDNLSPEDKKIYDREVIRLGLTLKSAEQLRINGETIVGMIHYPPFNYRFEDSDFTKLFEEYGVKKVIYGHLHGNSARFKDVVNKRETNFYLTSCDFLKNDLLEIY